MERVCVPPPYFGRRWRAAPLVLFATLSPMGFQNIQQNNALKNWLAMLIIFSAFVVFLILGNIAWPRGVVVAMGRALTVVYAWQFWIKPLI